MPLSIKPHISYLDKSFKESHTRSYIMAMQINMHGLTFSIYNPDKNKFIGLQHYLFDEKKTPTDFPLLFDLSYQKTKTGLQISFDHDCWCAECFLPECVPR